MLEEIDFHKDVHSIEFCTDPKELRRALGIVKSRLMRFRETGEAPDTVQMLRMIQLIGFLGIAGRDEAIGQGDPTFVDDRKFDESSPTDRTPEEIDAIFGVAEVSWAGLRIDPGLEQK